MLFKVRKVVLQLVPPAPAWYGGYGGRTAGNPGNRPSVWLFLSGRVQECHTCRPMGFLGLFAMLITAQGILHSS